MNSTITAALSVLAVAELDRSEWLTVGMALKEEGYPVEVWDKWSKGDIRYVPGECEHLWNGFRGSSTPVTGGSIVALAKQKVPDFLDDYNNTPLDWNDTIHYYPVVAMALSPAKKDILPTQELITYLETLFNKDEYVSYVTTDVYQNKNGKWCPGKGVYCRTAGELIDSLKAYPDDMSCTIGSVKPECGAWIRINPLDGEGIDDGNVTSYRFALVESDDLPQDEQERIFRDLELPIAALVDSAGKSIHAIVHIDADNDKEYRSRVSFLFDHLAKFGIPIDKQNKNPSRMSRMPGVMRNGKRQRLIATNIGKANWNEWIESVEDSANTLPKPIPLNIYNNRLPQKPPELIAGILRQGHKMLLSGSSKAGKSLLMMEMSIAIAEGSDWLGFKCKKGKVLYINLEIDHASTVHRFHEIYDKLGIPETSNKNITLWTLRGHSLPLDDLVPEIIKHMKGRHYDAVMIDPIYKVITGDENNASDMGYFCNQFDRICSETNASVIYCHHHSKGVQGSKRAMDRASGSGVFARDPDAQLDIIQLDTDKIPNAANRTAWRMESSLREFANISPVNFWFEYPLHYIDETGILKKASPYGAPSSNLKKSSKYTTAYERSESVDKAYEACSADGKAGLKNMANYLAITERNLRDRIKEQDGKYTIERGVVSKS